MNTYILPFMLAGNILFTWGFTQLRIPPSGGVPFSELVLVLCFFTFNTGAVLQEMGKVVCLAPFAIWWIFCIGSALSAVPEYGLWALRDASQALDSLFLIVGFNYAQNRDDLNRFLKWLPWLIGVAAVNTLISYSFQNEVEAISPQLVTEHGQTISLFGSFELGVTVLIWAAMYLIIAARSQVPSITRLILAGALVCYAIVMFQMRTTYLQLFCMIMLLIALRRNTAIQMLSFVPVLLIVVGAIGFLGIKVSGRIGGEISLSFFANHIAAIFGVTDGSDAAVTAAASGVDQRLEWWTALYEKVTADPATLLTGLGFGFPLVPFANAAGIQVREPHNSLMSVFSRSGLIGLTAFFWMQLELFRSAFWSFQASRQMVHWREWQNWLLVFFAFFLLVISGAGGEDVMEKPYFAIPYYFLWGVVLSLAHRLLPITHPECECGEVVAISTRANEGISNG